MGATWPSGKVTKIVVRVSRKPQPGTCMPRFSKPLILLALAAAIGAASLGGVQPAQAKSLSKCSSALINDWLFDGRVDKTYPVHCYREALRDVPEDQIVYGTLRQDLTRALQSAIRQNGGHVTGDTLVAPVGGSSDGSDPPSGTAATGDKGFVHWVAHALGPNTADSIPVPLLILGGLALALMAAAGVSLVARRMQARKAATDPPPSAL
jgi:hypothetical protein